MQNSNNFVLITENSLGKFYRRSIRDIETIFCLKDEQYYINYSYISNRYNNDLHCFRNIIVSKQFLEDLKIYCRNKTIEFTREISFENINELVNETNFFFKVSRGNNTIQGTYGPIDFIDIILFNLSSEYKQEVHNLMNSIQNLADNTNTTFIETLQNTINELQERVNNLEKENNKLNNKLKYINIVNKMKNNFHNTDLDDLRKELQSQFNEARFEAEERFQKLFQQAKLNEFNIISTVENNTKNNLKDKLINPTIEEKIEYIRCYVSYDELNNSGDNDDTTIVTNRCMYENLPLLDTSSNYLIFEDPVSNARETFNNYLRTTTIPYRRITCSKLSIKRVFFEEFTFDFTDFMLESKEVDVSIIVPREFSNSIQRNIGSYSNIILKDYFLENKWRTLYLDTDTNELFYNKLTSESTFIKEYIDLDHLVNKRIKFRNEYKVIQDININGDKYELKYTN